MKGKLIVIEGTNSSGKQTQAELLVKHLNEENITSKKYGFPDYNTPTGKIIGNCLLGKNGNSYFNDINNIPPKVAALYYAADRAYNIDKINSLLDKGINVILDRYAHSNMAYQAAKFEETSDKINMLLWMEQLEFNLLDLPKPDKVIFLYLPYEYRNDIDDDNLNLKSTEMVYSLMAERYGFTIINCIKDDKIRDILDIHEEIYKEIKDYLVNEMPKN